MEATGEPHDSKVVDNIVSTFFNAKPLADFDATPGDVEQGESPNKKAPDHEEEGKIQKKLHLGLNYTINLVLPKTDDPAIYNATFKALRENLLKD